MIKHHVLPLIMLVLLVSSCSFVLGDDPPDDPLSVYDSFWSILDRDYAGFYTKTDDDWTALRLAHRENVIRDPDIETVRVALTDIVTRLNDGHMILFAGPQEISVIPDYTTIQFDFSVVQERYLTDEQWDSSNMLCSGFLPDGTGYLWVSSFSGDGQPSYFLPVLDRFPPGLDLIIDLRNNGGGNSSKGEALLSHFIDRAVCYGRDIYHFGPDQDPRYDELWLHPAASTPRQHNIVILINEGSSSTTDMVIAGFQAYTGAYTIGKPSRAELIGNNVPRELVNGWILRVGTINNLMINDTIVDGDILPVDRDVANTAEHLAQGIDDQLDAAIARFTGR